MALKVTEVEVQKSIKLLNAQHEHQTEIKRAVHKAVEQYKVQLNAAHSHLQSKDSEHQLMMQKLQDKIQSLEVSLASQANLPSMGVSQSQDGASLHKEVFNFLPGTINKQRGVAQYESKHQTFSFQKQVRFEDRSSIPDLNPISTSGPSPQASTPYHGLLSANNTFDISQISLCGTFQDTATIDVDILAATAVQASK